MSIGFKHVTRVQYISQESLTRETDNGRSTLEEYATSALSYVASGAVRTAGDSIPFSRCLSDSCRRLTLARNQAANQNRLALLGWPSSQRPKAGLCSERPLGVVVYSSWRFDSGGWFRDLRTPFPAGPRGLDRCLFLLRRQETRLRWVQWIWVGISTFLPGPRRLRTWPAQVEHVPWFCNSALAGSRGNRRESGGRTELALEPAVTWGSSFVKHVGTVSSLGDCEGAGRWG